MKKNMLKKLTDIVGEKQIKVYKQRWFCGVKI